MADNAMAYETQRVKYLDSGVTGNMSNSITQNWTDQAIRCFYNNCDCNKCTITKGKYSFDCQMASVVRILYKDLGPPDKERIWRSIIKVS